MKSNANEQVSLATSVGQSVPYGAVIVEEVIYNTQKTISEYFKNLIANEYAATNMDFAFKSAKYMVMQGIVSELIKETDNVKIARGIYAYGYTREIFDFDTISDLAENLKKVYPDVGDSGIAKCAEGKAIQGIIDDLSMLACTSELKTFVAALDLELNCNFVNTTPFTTSPLGEVTPIGH